MKRVLLILLSVVMLLGTFTACGNGTPTDTTAPTTTQGLNDETTPSDTTEDLGGDDTDPSEETTTEPEEDTLPDTYVPENGFDTPETLTINLVDGEVNYTIIHPDKLAATSPAVKRAAYLSLSFSDLLGVSPSINTDWKRNNDSEAFEIVIGLTDYDETVAVLDDLKYGEYLIKAVGNKIVIMGYTAKAIENATKKFYDICRANRDTSTKTITVSAEELYVRETVDADLNILPVLGGKTKALYYNAGFRDTGKDCDMITITNTNSEGYSSYISLMEKAGYKLYTSTDMGKNKFATYTKDSYVVNLGYYPYDNSIRITVENGAPLVGLESENKFTKITSSQLSLLGQEVDGTENGLSELIRLEDGRFIVIDGGHGGANYMTAFVSEIKKQAAAYTDKPVIAAWIITHAHVDHDGLFRTHAKEIKNQGITVEKVFMNSQSSQAELDNLYAQGVSSDVLSLHGSIALCMSNANAIGATVYKTHAGQILYFANAKIEVLYTHETLYPEALDATNTTSTVMKITFTDSVTGEKTTFLSTGDATSKAFRCIYNNYSDYLACDILSMAHHGGTTGEKNKLGEPAKNTSKAYEAVNPTLALWPMGSIRLIPVYKSQKDVDDKLFACSNLKEVYIAGHVGDVTIVPLPYVVGNVDGKLEWDIANAALKK